MNFIVFFVTRKKGSKVATGGFTFTKLSAEAAMAGEESLLTKLGYDPNHYAAEIFYYKGLRKLLISYWQVLKS